MKKLAFRKYDLRPYEVFGESKNELTVEGDNRSGGLKRIYFKAYFSILAIPKGSEPRCRYCKRRLIFHNNGEGADCLKQLELDI